METEQPGFRSTTGAHTVLDRQGGRARSSSTAQAFGAEELFRLDEPGGRVGHAEIRIGDSDLMLADEYPGLRRAESHLGRRLAGEPPPLCRRRGSCRREGGVCAERRFRPVKDEFYGDRTGMVADPFGHRWQLATAVEAVSAEEVKARYEAAIR